MNRARPIHRPSKQTIQWDGDNLHEIESALDDFVTSMSAAGGVLRIIGMGGLELSIQLGDVLLIEGDRLGVIRERTHTKDEDRVVWKGSNIEDFALFLKGYKVRMAVAGDALLIHGGPKPIILSRGDRLVKRDGQIIVSIAGKGHQA